MPKNEETLFQQLGGAEVLAEIVRDMYARVHSDPELAPFFANVSMDHLSKMQYEFLVAAFNGPVSYSGAELTATHRGRGITGHHFARFCGHFADAVEERDISPHVLDQALARLSMYKGKITGEINPGG